MTFLFVIVIVKFSYGLWFSAVAHALPNQFGVLRGMQLEFCVNLN